MKTASVTRRLTISVLLMELVAAISLIAAVAVDEYVGQSRTLDANLRAAANALLGATQEGPHNDVRLDMRGVALPRGARFTVEDEQGSLLGSAGELPPSTPRPGSFEEDRVAGCTYRMFTLMGERIIDPDRPDAVHHRVTIVVGLPQARVWHEVFEAIQFFSVCTLVLLGITGILMAVLVRKQLAPIRALAAAADAIDSHHWTFAAPAGAAALAELRPLAEAIERTIARLQLSFEQQKRFTSDAAHELKTDLAIVKSSIQLLAMRQRSVPEYEQGLTVSLVDLTRLENTVQKMLALARLEQAADEPAQRCRLDDVLREVVRQAEPLAQLSSITLYVVPLDAAIVSVDASDATLLCSNIVMNALQHTPKRGRVEIASHMVGQEVRVTVHDSGEGVRAEDAHLLFEPFYRSDASRSRKTGGTGLGLSICKVICDRAGGSICIGNAKERGAIVEFRLPAFEPHIDAAFSDS